VTKYRFVARQAQLIQLEAFLDQALQARGQIAFVVGEAGSGKTALITEFASRMEKVDNDLVVAIGNCNAQTGIGDPYLPFREILSQLTGSVSSKLTRGAITSEKAHRLRSMIGWTCEAILEFGPDLINLLVPGTALVAKAGAFVLDQFEWPEKFKKLVEHKAAAPLGSALDQSHVFEQYTNVIKALTQKGPLVLVLDDLQWADSASISLLFHLGRRIGESRILVLGAYRPEEVKLGRGDERHPLEKVLAEFKRYYGDVSVDLDQAERDEAQRFVDALVDLEPNRLGDDFRQAMVRHTGGHPLFTVELLRNMQEQGDLERDADGSWVEGKSLNWDKLPPRVEGVIEERIDRLDDNMRETVTVGSVEGVDFTAEVIARVRNVDERDLVRRLSNELDRRHHLVMSIGSRRIGEQPLSSYRFRHNLFQKYLYDGLDEAQKIYLHEDVGTTLESIYGDQAGEVASQLARHFHEAGLTKKAIHYLGLAGEGAMRVSANTEAISYFNRALRLLKTCPPSTERDRMELTLQMGLSTAMIITQGWSAPGVRVALDRARILCCEGESLERLFPIVRSLYTHYHAIGEHCLAYELAQQLSVLTQESKDPTLLVITHQALGQSQGEMGDPVAARETLKLGLRYHDPDQYRSLVHMYGEEHGISSHVNLVIDLYVLGYADQALMHGEKAMALAEALDHVHVLAYATYIMSAIFTMRGEYDVALEFAEKTLRLCNENRIPFYAALTGISSGYILAMKGSVEEGLAEVKHGLSFYRSIGARVLLTIYLDLLAEVQMVAGQVDESLATVEEGLAAVGEMSERIWEAELYRLRAQLLLKQGNKEQAEADLYKAIEIARAQQARMWELRASTVLSRLLRDQGRRAEARQMLGNIYGWFMEGLDLPDLIEAKVLLEELG
jgi:tetratricopeptide (TPR) repeat protein